jgi:hypothetical protein
LFAIPGYSDREAINYAPGQDVELAAQKPLLHLNGL